MRGFGPLGILAFLVIVFAGTPGGIPLGGILVLAWAWRSRTPWRDIGYVRPRSWVATVAVGVAFGAAFKLVMKAVVMPLLGADPINPTYHYLVGNATALPAILFAVTFGAGFGEETVFRGYLFERFGKLLGRRAWAKALTVVVTAAGFGFAHYHDQGLPGAQQGAVVGLVYGTIFAATGRIWMLIVAHAAFDVTAVAIIYWDLETAVARLIFR